MNARKLGLTVIAFAALVVLAQAAQATHEEVVKGMLGTLDDITKVLIEIKDEQAAVTARPDLKKHGDRMAELRKKAQDLPQPSKEEKDRLEQNYKGKFEATLKKLRTESVRVKAIPGGEETLKELAVLEDKKKPKE